MFVTHDRTFLQKIATRIVEIDRGKLFSFSCDYTTYLERRQAMQEAEEKQWQTFDKKLAQEEIWVRQGVKASRTRNEGRVRALMAMREERAAGESGKGMSGLPSRRPSAAAGWSPTPKRSILPTATRRSSIPFPPRILRGDRVGIIGPNGSGKTTLLKVLLGELPISGGKIRLGTGIAIAYFDQLRAQFDESKSLKDNIADGNDTVFINGAPRHIVGYLQDFLFPPHRFLRRYRLFPAANETDCFWPSFFARRPMFWCWMNRPMTWTRKRWNFWKIVFWNTVARFCLSAMTGRFSTTSSLPRLCWKGKGACRNMWAVMTTGSGNAGNSGYVQGSTQKGKGQKGKTTQRKKKIVFQRNAGTRRAAAKNREDGKRESGVYEIAEFSGFI